MLLPVVVALAHRHHQPLYIGRLRPQHTPVLLSYARAEDCWWPSNGNGGCALAVRCLFLLAAMFGDKAAQRLPSASNVASQQFTGGFHIAFTAKLEQRAMFFTSAFQGASQVELQADIAFAVEIDVTNHRHELRPVGAFIKRRVKHPIEPSPFGNVAFVAQSSVVSI